MTNFKLKIDFAASLLGDATDQETKVQLLGMLLSDYPLSELKNRIKTHNDTGYQGAVGAGYRILAKIMFQLD